MDNSAHPLPSIGIMNLPNTLQTIHPHRLLRQRRNSKAMPQALLLTINVIIRDCSVCRNTIIPQTNRLIIPLDSDLNVLRLGDVFEQQLEQGLRLLVFETNNSLGKARVYEKGFLAGCLIVCQRSSGIDQRRNSSRDEREQ